MQDDQSNVSKTPPSRPLNEQQRKRGYERFFDMPLNTVAGQKHIPRGVPTVIVAIVRFLVKIIFRLHVDGRQSIIDLAGKTGVVVIGNHTSYLDVVCMYLSIKPPVWPRFIARESLFEGKPLILSWLLARLGVIPVKRDSADRTAIKRAARFLKDKEVVGIMPEGTRRGKTDMAPTLHAGAALIARMGHAPILPMTVRDVDKVKRKGERLRFPKVTAEFGTPVLLADFDFLPKEKRLEGCTWYAMRECFALSLRCSPDEVDMRALFPDSEDFSMIFADHPIPRHTSSEVVATLEA